MNVNYSNINEFLKLHKSHNTCEHNNLNINYKDFEIIGNLYDDTYGFLSYLSVNTNSDKEVIIGCYPLQDCDVLKCNACGQIVFSFVNTGGLAPRTE